MERVFGINENPSSIEVDSCQRFRRDGIDKVMVNFRVLGLSDDGKSFVVGGEIPFENRRFDSAVFEAQQLMFLRLDHLVKIAFQWT